MVSKQIEIKTVENLIQPTSNTLQKIPISDVFVASEKPSILDLIHSFVLVFVLCKFGYLDFALENMLRVNLIHVFLHIMQYYPRIVFIAIVALKSDPLLYSPVNTSLVYAAPYERSVQCTCRQSGYIPQY